MIASGSNDCRLLKPMENQKLGTGQEPALCRQRIGLREVPIHSLCASLC